MSSYVVLARKWRPAQFSDIVGQGHVVRTFMNAIRSGRIHQAYLFTGSRGIGKTSIARIFSKAIRCESARWDGSWLRSCDACPSCKEIASGNGVDVTEIDGASNNGVDAVREIRENAKYLPATGTRKIYIVDEVHMLTTAAFNALLKTLEEPPPHVIFVMATTEPHKIPATILSRCQRFDFRRVTVAQIQDRLTEIIQSEGIKAEPGALALIARAAEGSMRDALSLLDQVIAFSGDTLTTQSTRDSVGLIEGQTVLGIVSAIFARKPLDALTLLEEAYDQGHDLRVLTRSLIELLHACVLARVGAANPKGLEFSEDEWTQIQSMAARRPLEEMELIFQVLNHGIDWIARSPQPKLILDVLLVKCASAEALVRIEDLPPSGASDAGPPPRAAAPTPVAPAPSAGPLSWEGLIDRVRQERPLLASMLEHGSCARFPQAQENEIEICFRPEEAYYRDQLQTRLYNEQLGAIAKAYFGRQVLAKIALREAGESLAARKNRETEERDSAIRSAAQNHPVIREAQALFGGELGPIELTEKGDPRD